MMDRYPIIGLPHGMVLVVGRVFGPLGSADVVRSAPLSSESPV